MRLELEIARLKLGKTKTGLAVDTGIRRERLSGIFSGRIVPTRVERQLIAVALNAPVRSLFGSHVPT